MTSLAKPAATADDAKLGGNASSTGQYADRAAYVRGVAEAAESVGEDWIVEADAGGVADAERGDGSVGEVEDTLTGS